MIPFKYWAQVKESVSEVTEQSSCVTVCWRSEILGRGLMVNLTFSMIETSFFPNTALNQRGFIHTHAPYLHHLGLLLM